MTNFNVCEGVLVEQYGDRAVLDIIGALAAAAETIEEERRIFALGAQATRDFELVGVA